MAYELFEIDRTFKSSVLDEELKMQQKRGEVKEFSLTSPVWSALYLKEVLTAETYEEVDKKP